MSLTVLSSVSGRMSTMLDVRDRRLAPALQARSPSRAGGSEGNRRLTASTAAVLLALLAAEGATLLAIRPLVSAHVFIGMLLVPPIALKISTTGYRFLRYYTGGPEYVSAGPPHPLLRLLGPVVVLSTAALFGTGVALIALGPEHGRVLGLHKASFVVWFGAMGLHVLAHVLRLPRLVTADWKPVERLPGASLRAWILVGTLVVGAVLAVATVHLAAPWHSFHSFDG